MNILIKKAHIIDTKSKHHKKTRDILIINGKIKSIKKNIDNLSNYRTFTANNLHISPGWFDFHVNFGEPGNEQKETLESGANAAASGGFTGVMTMPNTSPRTDNKSMIEFIKSSNKNHIVEIVPSGNITKNGDGNELVEMHDMSKAGCLAFTDDKNSISNNELMKIAMLYSKDCNALIINHPTEENLTNNSHMHEGEISTRLGLKGMPDIAEEIIVNRDIILCEYTESKTHLSYVSAKRSVDRVRKAKKKGINITCDVSINNIIFTDEMLNDFDSRYKVKPPLRTIIDKKALIKGLQDNTIDIITSDHSPHEKETKKIEFNNAAFGILGLESLFGLIGKYILPHIEISQIIEKIAINPRKILKLEDVVIEEGNKANMTFFDPPLSWKLTNEMIKSKSDNTPLIGKDLIGKALAIYNNGKLKKC